MATRTVVCPECDEPVPYGRLSCPNCGSLLASVAGAPRRSAPLEAVLVAEPPTLVPDDGSNGHAPPAVTVEVAGAPRAAAPRARRTSSRAAPSAAAAPATDSAPEPAEPTVEPTPPADEIAPTAAPGDLDDAAEPAPPDVEAPPSPSAVDATADDVPRWPGEAPAPTWTRPTPPVIQDWPPAEAGPSHAGSAAAPAAVLPSPAAPVAWPAPPPVIPGLQPATTTSEVVPLPHARPALPPTPAGSWLPPTASFGPAQPNGATAGNGHLPAAAGTDPERTSPGGRASWLADLPFDAPDDLAGWLVTIGSAIAIVGFLLPWSTRMPFAAGEFGYTDRWGLAVPSHLLLLLATLLLLVSSVRPTPIPGWLRAGVAPLVLGGLLLGIVWPFVIGGFGSQIGSLAVAMAAMLLVAGGGLAIRAERHAKPGSGV